jgi:hypothetical protein
MTGNARAVRARALLAALLGALLLATPGTLARDDTEPVVHGLGADTEVLRESFDSEAAWMVLGEDETGLNELRDGRLFSSVIAPPSLFWMDVPLETAVPVLRVEADVLLAGGDGVAAGPACGSAAGLRRYLVAGVNEGGWWLGRLIDGRLQVIVQGDLDAGSRTGEGLQVAIECAVVPAEGGDRVTMAIDGMPVDLELPRLEIPVGPYDKAALLVGTDGERGNAGFDDLVVSVGDAYAPPSPGSDPG